MLQLPFAFSFALIESLGLINSVKGCKNVVKELRLIAKLQNLRGSGDTTAGISPTFEEP